MHFHYELGYRQCCPQTSIEPYQRILMAQHELNFMTSTRLYIKHIVYYIFRQAPKTPPPITGYQKLLYKHMQANYCRPRTLHASTTRLQNSGAKNVVHPNFNVR